MKTLRQYSKEEGISYAGAYKRYTDKRIPDSYKAADGKIYVGKQEEIQIKQTAPIIFDNLPSTVSSLDFDEATASTTTRTNQSAFVNLSDRYKHLLDSPIPFTYAGAVGYKQSDVSVKDAVILCQRAYWGFSIFRATIELFTEFCVNNIYFKGGSKKSRLFFEMFFQKIGLNKLQDIFFRELWRSGNCFIYKFLGRLEGQEYKDLVKLFGGNINRSKAEIPIRYILLNPADIQAQGSITFDRPTYLQVLSDYELERLRNPRTDQDKAVLDSLSPDDKAKIKKKGAGAVYRTLDTKDIVAVFLSKQSYEAFSVPLGFGVLEHLNHKKELEQMDQAIARTVQQAVLLVTTGAPPDQGGINYKNIENLRKIFENESIGRVLVADYTTKVSFVIPTISDILDPRKYEEINASIAIGLGNVFLIQGEKFANQNAKIDIFLQRLQGARRLFLEEFLIPEMKSISKELGFKGEIPQPYYEELDLKNEIEYNKIYVRLAELGLLSPSECFDAMESGRLPTNEDSVESQESYKKLKDKGYYQPLMSKQDNGEGGRPVGTKAPQSTKKISPIGAEFSVSKIKDNILKSQITEGKIQEILKQKHNIKELTTEQEIVVQDILSCIVKNERVENWNSCIADYIDNPDKRTELSKTVDEICSEFKVDSFMGGILLNSKMEKE